MVTVIGVRFKRAGKIYFFNPENLDIKAGMHVIVETARGIEYGLVAVGRKEIEEDKIVQPLKEVIRIATPEDDEADRKNKEKEKEAFDICLEKIRKHELAMKLIACEYTFDNNKVMFYFTADGRIDFRELVKDLAFIFKTRIELRQIGVRDEAKMKGGVGICGRPLCCHTFLSEFVPVSIKMAKDQNFSLNPSKISGVCGRLMCCLKYEQNVYEEKLKKIPPCGTYVITNEGKGIIVDSYTLSDIVKVKIVNEDNNTETIKPFFVDDIAVTKERDMAYAKKDEDIQFEYVEELL